MYLEISPLRNSGNMNSTIVRQKCILQTNHSTDTVTHIKLHINLNYNTHTIYMQKQFGICP